MITPNSESSHQHLLEIYQENKLASLKDMLVRDYDPASYSLTWVRCRAASVAKKIQQLFRTLLSLTLSLDNLIPPIFDQVIRFVRRESK